MILKEKKIFRQMFKVTEYAALTPAYMWGLLEYKNYYTREQQNTKRICKENSTFLLRGNMLT